LNLRTDWPSSPPGCMERESISKTLFGDPVVQGRSVLR
jgi:hypothetical protein